MYRAEAIKCEARGVLKLDEAAAISFISQAHHFIIAMNDASAPPGVLHISDEDMLYFIIGAELRDLSSCIMLASSKSAALHIAGR